MQEIVYGGNGIEITIESNSILTLVNKLLIVGYGTKRIEHRLIKCNNTFEIKNILESEGFTVYSY